MIQVKPQALSPDAWIAQAISSVGHTGLSFSVDPTHCAVRRFHPPFHFADGAFAIFGARAVAKIEADRHRDVLRALVKGRQFSASSAAGPADAATMTFFDPCAAMALPPSREYLTR